ncbi:MAG: flagellar motor switch protein FliN [Verrucomicrobiae bacterium]|nr:flagellar motor switch protein FliN [Verrucomicrobiae bacterium]
MDPSPNASPNLDVLLDVPVKLTVELGACRMPMREVLRLAAGSVVQLDKVADSPVDLFVNQRRIARGEVVVVDDRFGIKITEIVSG